MVVMLAQCFSLFFCHRYLFGHLSHNLSLLWKNMALHMVSRSRAVVFSVVIITGSYIIVWSKRKADVQYFRINILRKYIYISGQYCTLSTSMFLCCITQKLIRNNYCTWNSRVKSRVKDNFIFALSTVSPLHSSVQFQRSELTNDL